MPKKIIDYPAEKRPLLNALEIAEQAHASKTSAQNLIRDKKIPVVKTEGKTKYYAADNPDIQQFIADYHEAEKGKAQQAEFKNTKVGLELRKLRAAAEKLEIANEKARDALIDRHLVSVALGRIYSAHTSILIPTGAKITDQLAAEAAVSDPAVKLRMQEILDDEHYSFLATIEKEINEFLRKYKEPEIGGDLPEKMGLKKKRPKKK
ncbi:hypothetical protein LQZ19_08615 [Treponema primitia]|uniref:hypothetical protein n=1 Tax=Treponema primitia TaxID=88058 RepID=UPI00397FF13E